MTADPLFTIIGATVGSVTVVGLALAILILRVTSKLDADRRAFQAAADADWHAFQAGMDTFRAEMQRLAERQSTVEGRLTAPGSAAD